MHPILLKLGPLTIYSYGLLVALGFLAGIGLAVWLAKKEGIPTEQILDLAVYVLLASIIGARLFYVIEFWRDFAGNPISVFYIWQGGLVFFGGLLFVILAVIAYARFFKVPLFKVLDVIAPAAALGYALGRIGCFLNGCCYGIETNLPWAVKFPALSGLRHPTQLYASLSGLLILGLLLFIFYRKKFDGQVFSLGLIFYAVYRFAIEFIRTNPRYLLGLTAAQWGSILILLIAASLYYKLNRA